MNALPFLRANARWLAAGALMTLGTSFGQTFFISLYAGAFRAEFGLSHGDWGGIYMIATLASAALLTQAGRLADMIEPRVLALIILAVFAGTCVGVSQVSSAWMLGVLVFLLRFCGQGMLGHVAVTAMAKWYVARRARAVAIASLGFSFGESAAPLASATAIAAFGWRGSWLAAAAVLGLVLLPALAILLARDRSPASPDDAGRAASTGLGGRDWTRPEMLRHWLFWAILPGLLAPSFIATTAFFQVVPLTEVKGWDLWTYTSLAYPAYSVTTVICSLIFGWLVDARGSFRILPFYLAPMGAGIALLGAAESLTAGVAGLLLMGVTQGALTAVYGALWAEAYGTRHLGAIRALYAAATVFASALGPGLSGQLLDAGVGVAAQFYGMGVYIALVCALFAFVAARVRREAAAGVAPPVRA